MSKSCQNTFTIVILNGNSIHRIAAGTSKTNSKLILFHEKLFFDKVVYRSIILEDDRALRQMTSFDSRQRN